MAQELTREQRDILKECDLSQLSLPDFSKEGDKIRRNAENTRLEQERYRQQYGADWFQRWCKDRGIIVDYSRSMKWTNTMIYDGVRHPVNCMRGSPEGLKSAIDLFFCRLQELYGENFADEYAGSDLSDRSERLVLDALKTGKWKELPDELQDEYRKRMVSRV